MRYLLFAAAAAAAVCARGAASAVSEPRTLAVAARMAAVDAQERGCTSVFRRTDTTGALEISAEKPRGLALILR